MIDSLKILIIIWIYLLRKALKAMFIFYKVTATTTRCTRCNYNTVYKIHIKFSFCVQSLVNLNAWTRYPMWALLNVFIPRFTISKLFNFMQLSLNCFNKPSPCIVFQEFKVVVHTLRQYRTTDKKIVFLKHTWGIGAQTYVFPPADAGSWEVKGSWWSGVQIKFSSSLLSDPWISASLVLQVGLEINTCLIKCMNLIKWEYLPTI